MAAEVTVRQNVERVLKHLGLEGSVTITQEVEDRVFGWPNGGFLRQYVENHDWYHDPGRAAGFFHGARSESFREPDGFHPALQIVFHPSPAGDFVEIDLDEAAPVDVVSGVWHLWEVLTHTVRKTVTDQKVIAKLLNERFHA